MAGTPIILFNELGYYTIGCGVVTNSLNLSWKLWTWDWRIALHKGRPLVVRTAIGLEGRYWMMRSSVRSRRRILGRRGLVSVNWRRVGARIACCGYTASNEWDSRLRASGGIVRHRN
jgi:hypothetical protein